MKGRKGFREKRPPIRSWLDTNFRPGFRGYSVVTVAFYRPKDTLATKVVVSVMLTEINEPDVLERWFSERDLDVRHDPAIGEEILAFLRPYEPHYRGDRRDYRTRHTMTAGRE